MPINFLVTLSLYIGNEELSKSFMATLNHDVLAKVEEEDANDSDFLPCVIR